MVESPFSKFKEDKVRMLSVQVHKGMLQVQGEIHQVKQRLSSVIIVKAKGKELDEEQLAFLTDPGVADGQVAQTITHNATFQTDDLDAYDSDCDDISSAKAVLMANLSSCDSDVLSEDKANNESKIVNESLTAELERYKERVKILEQRFNVDLSACEKFIDSQMDDMIRIKNTKFAAYETKTDTLKQTLSKHVKEKESLLTTLNGFKTEFKKRESKSIDKEIVLETKIKNWKNIVRLLDEITEVQTVFTQMEVAAEQCFVDRKCYEIQQE
ncbi:hypothetical protein Tco_0624006 [Tanacetum coccineum]|uniref:Uncharacterized protein n=1 Tax=Tanacetum coccineum TaxID=301880 RepID=A0ABQ4WCS3_9ASTR